jgi:hypothetical protein
MTCPRLFEVEAARDGRLTGSELQRFRSHVGHCAVCAREAGELDALARSLRSLPAMAGDELHARRERTRLLAAFDASLVPARASTSRWLVPLLAAATLTLLALTLWYSRAPARGPVAVAPRPREAISVQASPASQWSRQTESHRETIILTAGTLSVAIDHALSPRRLRVVLPDGELEDLGTTFTVTATATSTTHVSVQDGTVILRLRERAPIVLNANDSWSPSAPGPAALPAPSHAAAAPAQARSAPARAREPATAAPVSSAPGAARDSASDFRSALTAFNAGNNALAAQLFSSFLTQHPSATNAEDAAYLRILALQRAGNLAAMQAAARDYLARYPSAFRRAEVEPLTH